MTREQMEFAQRHGITRLPAIAALPMRWHTFNDPHLTEQEVISDCARYSPLVPANAWLAKGLKRSAFLRKGVPRRRAKNF